MEREAKDPARHFHAPSPSKKRVPSVLRRFRHVLVRVFYEGVREDDLILVKKFVVLPLNLRLYRVECAVDRSKTVVGVDGVKVGCQWESPGESPAYAFDGAQSRICGCEVGQ